MEQLAHSYERDVASYSWALQRGGGGGGEIFSYTFQVSLDTADQVGQDMVQISIPLGCFLESIEEHLMVLDGVSRVV